MSCPKVLILQDGPTVALVAESPVVLVSPDTPTAALISDGPTALLEQTTVLTAVLNEGTPGQDGEDGEAGADGASAYEIAVAEGFVGDVTAWLASLVGPAGADGADGDDGAPGPNEVTSATSTDLTGLLLGDGAIVGTATVTGGLQLVGGALSIADGGVTYARIQPTSTTDVLLGRSSAGGGTVEEIACTAFARTLLADANAPAVRSTLGLGTAALIASKAWRGTIDGLTLANNGTDPNNDIDIAAGVAWDSAASALLELLGSITKRLDASWSVGSGNGGLDTGSKANSTWYHVWLIGRSDTGVVDALFSTSATAPTMPVNYDQKVLIESVLTDGSGNIRAFTHTGNRMEWGSLITDYTAASPSTSRTLVGVSTPPGRASKWIGRAIVNNSSAGANMELGSAGTTSYGIRAYCPTANQVNSISGTLVTNTTPQLAVVASTASGWTNFIVATSGWERL